VPVVARPAAIGHVCGWISCASVDDGEPPGSPAKRLFGYLRFVYICSCLNTQATQQRICYGPRHSNTIIENHPPNQLHEVHENHHQAAPDGSRREESSSFRIGQSAAGAT